MTDFFEKSQSISVSRISSEGWWLDNSVEHVVKGTALGDDFTQVIYTPSTKGMTAQFNHALGQWLDEIKDLTLTPFYDISGHAFYLSLPDGKYPEDAIMQAPPVFDTENQTVLYQNSAWEIFDIELGKRYWDDEACEFIISDINFTLPENHSFIMPPVAEKGCVVRLKKGIWHQIEDHRDALIYDHQDCQNSKRVEEIGTVESGFTLDMPNTIYDKWKNEGWVTNQSNQYIGNFNDVDSTRRSLYSQGCDPLMFEASMKRLQNKENEASELETQALAARAKIETENPWPPSLK
ncbi:hypothetical protein JI57_03920 [Psychromonas sp. PRT-SC03]|nr:hypothetical protein JI57_03920 [Psychromonas sp. PRT-SC03]